MNFLPLRCRLGHGNIIVPVLDIQAAIRAANTHVQNAEGAFIAGDLRRAESLHHQAQLSCIAILRWICESRDDEVMAVEPAFTEFEERLLKLAARLGPHARNGGVRAKAHPATGYNQKN